MTLIYTIPDHNAVVVDTTLFDCAGGPPTRDIDSLFVVGIPSTGGGERRVFAKSVRGREGQSDSCSLTLAGWRGGHFFVLVADTARNVSCASNRVWYGSTTGVGGDPPGLVLDHVAEVYFDVQGRRVDHPKASGIYFRRRYLNGRVLDTRRVVILK